MTLNRYQKDQLLEFIDGQAIEETELQSYTRYPAPDPGLDRFAEPDGYDWDDDEYYQAQGQQAVDKIKDDGLSAYLDMDDNLKEEAIKYISDKTGCDE